MTANELYTTVAEMGFARTLEDTESYFIRAVNLSIARIARTFPLYAEYDVTVTAGTAYYTDLPVGEARTDFMAFPSHPLSREGVLLHEGRDFLVRGGTLRIAREAAGPLSVRYLRRPALVTEDTKEEPLDVAPYAEGLLPLLCASYLWLDDRGDLATHYLALYRTEAEELKAQLYRHGGSKVSCPNGWDTTS